MARVLALFLITELALFSSGCGGGDGGVEASQPLAIAALSDRENSAYSYEVRVPLVVTDRDGELSITATADDVRVVDVIVDNNSMAIVLRPQERGDSRVTVDVRDGNSLASTSFNFTVQDVTRTVELSSPAPETEAVVLINGGSTTTDFELTHNGYLAFSSMDQILEKIRSLPDEVNDEPLERKIWRFVRDNVYHGPSVSEEGWLLATWPVLNSFGWGLCSNVSAVFVQIARAAGYEARIWELTGHVVPEIRVNGIWHMYDPDLAVYYHKLDGSVAGIADLTVDSALVTSPIGAILDTGANYSAYSQAVGSIYASVADNRIVDYVSPEPLRGSRITLPSGARLIYPGRWTAAPIGYDAGSSYTIDQFRQARIELPASYAGMMPVPWVLWDIQGSGSVRVLGRDFAVGSTELRDFLAHPGSAVTEIEVVNNPSGLALIMMINPLWYDMREDNELNLTGKDVWAIVAGTYPLAPENLPPPPLPASLMKPRACGDGYGNQCDADINNSGGIVNFADLALFRAAFGTTNATGDLNASGGIVNFADLALFRAAFGTTIAGML